MDNKKICFAASSGGHLEQLMMLEPLMLKYRSFIVTEKTLYKSYDFKTKHYFVSQVNRTDRFFIMKLILISFKSLFIFLKERPDYVICTGVLAMLPLCIFTKIFRKRLVYIESFAKVTTPTETGKLLYRFVDRFYVQWETLCEVFPSAIYKGGIY